MLHRIKGNSLPPTSPFVISLDLSHLPAPCSQPWRQHHTPNKLAPRPRPLQENHDCIHLARPPSLRGHHGPFHRELGKSQTQMLSLGGERLWDCVIWLGQPWGWAEGLATSQSLALRPVAPGTTRGSLIRPEDSLKDRGQSPQEGEEKTRKRITG